MPLEETFLGRGWAFPPTFSRGGAGVGTVADEEDVRQSLEILLGTQPGERVMQELFGCDLASALFEELDEGLLNTINRLVEDAILYHEPRIRLEQVDVTPSDPASSAQAPRTLLINVSYTIRSTNSRFNLVYPFYLQEASLPG